MPPQQQKDIWLNLCSVITVFIVFLPPVRVNVKRWFTTGKYYHNQALMSRFSLLFFYIFAKRKELWFNADKFEILHVSCSFVNDPVHRDVIHSASAIHSLGRFCVLQKFVIIRRAGACSCRFWVLYVTKKKRIPTSVFQTSSEWQNIKRNPVWIWLHPYGILF